jgi:hypothetical protein
LGFFGHLLVHLEFSLVRCNQSYLGHSWETERNDLKSLKIQTWGKKL